MADTQTTNVTSREQISNPYSRENRAKYKMGVIENWLHNMGFKTGYDTYHMEMDNNANAWETQNQSAAYEENYNSAEAEAQRMRNAGLNPDIDPSTVQPGMATEMTEPETTIPTKGQTDIDYFQQVGSFAANLGATLIDMYTGGVSAKAALTGAKVALGRYESDRDIAEDEYIKNAALEELQTIGSDEEYENGAYIARMKGLTGKRYEKFSRYYDEILKGIPALIARNDTEKAAKNSVFENEMTDKLNTIREIMAEAEKKDGEIILEKRKREQEFLIKHPEYTENMLLAGFTKEINEAKMSGDQAAIIKMQKDLQEWRKIEAEAEHEITKNDQEYIHKFQTGTTEYDYSGFNGDIPEDQRNHTIFWYMGGKNVAKWLKYRKASKRHYGNANDNYDIVSDVPAKVIGVVKK